ncbi:hypothetical protein [Neobacillus vireti]|uniref:hypothetical protein n=1 Tax=Neobacillus vireti TaxID=220686 RepID=UPI002FFFAAAC
MDGTKISVDLATDLSGKATITAAQVVKALNENANQLVTATSYRGNNGAFAPTTNAARLTDGLKVGADLWNKDTKRWQAVGFQPAFAEGHEEAMEFAIGLIGLIKVAYNSTKDHQPPSLKARPGIS